MRKLFAFLFLYSCSAELDQLQINGSIEREEFFVDFKKTSGEGILTDRHSCLGKNELLTCELQSKNCLLYTSPSPRDQRGSRMPSSA